MALVWPAQAQNGATALHHAASSGHAAVVGKLLAAGADANTQNGSGNTALHLAAAKGAQEFVGHRDSGLASLP